MKYQAADVIKQKAGGVDHVYTLRGMFHHINRHGFAADVLVWSGRCVTCGAQVETQGTGGTGTVRQLAMTTETIYAGSMHRGG